MPPQPLRPLALLLSILLPPAPATAVAADLGTEAYRLPLVGPYAIYRPDRAVGGSAAPGPHQLVEVAPSGPGVGLSTHTRVAAVEPVAAQGRVIFGKSADGYFILDARRPDQQPQVANTRGEWETALRGLGITDPDAVKGPDALAVEVSEQILRPWKYRAMGGRFGASDDVWSSIVQLLGFATAFAAGFARPRGRSPAAVAVVLGLVVNVVAQVVIAGGGPGALVGFLVLPLLYMLAAVAGKGVRAATSGGRPAGA